LALSALLAVPLGGCVYRMNIQQGNYLEGKTVDQLQLGMTRSQVRYLLGTPLVPAVFLLASGGMVVNALVTDPVNTAVTLLIVAAGLPVYWARARLAGLPPAGLQKSS